jgi:uncharacterized protein
VDLILLFTGMLLGLVVIPFGFPGTFIIAISIFIYAYLTDFTRIGIPLLIAIALLTVVAETADNWLTALGAKRFGASSGSIWLSLVGGLLGAIVIGGPLALALGPFGPLVGGFAGAFAIVVAHELYRHGNWNDALRAGWGTFLGRMAGIVLKLVISVAIVIAVALAVAF